MLRKFGLFLAASALLLTVAAPVSAGQSTYNSSGSALTAQGGWDSFDEATGSYEYGWVSGWQAQGEPAFVEFYGGSFREIVCTPAHGNQPATTSYLETFRYGGGPGSLSIGRVYSVASASATIDIWTDTYNGCTGEYTSSIAEGVAVALELSGSGDLIKETGTWSFKIPGQYNSHSRYSSTYRPATGTASLAGEAHDVYGAIGKVSWSDHSNG
ncbi:MAG TPA: hypothetical protein VIH00_01570 [Candidatus Limnocylindrales bacterium]|nr:MAG: hypothetical protein A2V84_00690 [Chloroflexi bacterium RBG_16_70_13]